MNTLPFDIRPLEGRPGLRVIGELDLATAPRLQEALEELPLDGEITLDLGELEFMDSTGLHVIASFALARAAAKLLKANGNGHIVIDSPSPALLRTFDILGVDGYPGVEVRRDADD